MGKKLIFTDDRIDEGTNDELEIFANSEGLITIQMTNQTDDYCYNVIKINKDTALEIIDVINEQLGLL